MIFIKEYSDLIDVVAAILCLVFSIVFISKTNKKNSSILFLGLYLLVYSSESIGILLNLFPAFRGNPRLELLPINLLLLRHPLLLMYVQKLAYFNKKTLPKYFFLFGFFEFIFFLILFIFNIQGFLHSKLYVWHIILGNIYMLVFSIYILKWIKKHLQEYGDKYNKLLKGQIKWVRNYIWADMLLGFFLVVFPFFYYPKWLAFVFWLYYLGLTFWTVYRGFYHIGMFDFSSIKLSGSNPKKTINHQSFSKDFDRIKNHVSKKETFTNPDLSIQDVSKSLNIPAAKVSQAINGCSNMNFKAYVNSIRIEYSKELLRDAKYDKYSIEGIANETGFKSRSAFYTAFKTNTSLTPAQFKKKQV